MDGYTTYTRVSREQVYNSTNSALGRFVAPRKAEYTYSWRSGVDQTHTGPGFGDRNHKGNFGISNPKSKGSLTDIVSDRKRWLDEIGQTFGGVNTPTDQSICPIYSATDTGHRFINVKWESLREGRVRVIHRDTGVEQSSLPWFATPYAYVPVEWDKAQTVFPHSKVIPTGQPTTTERQARLNSAFHAMAPTAPVAQISETLVSLMRGEFPSILRSILALRRKYELDLKETASNLGGEYLNSVFGWKPLIEDIMKCIRILMAVDYLIYGSATRRKRTIKFDSRYLSEPYESFFFAPTYMPKRWGSGFSSTTNVLNYTHSPERTVVSKMDIRISARMVPLARPGLGSDDFISRAEDLLRQLGVWYPTLGWDLLPYSWLVDWCLHLGTALANASYYGSKPGQTNIDYAWATTALRVDTQVNFPVMRAPAKGTSRRDFLFYGSPMTTSVVKIRERATPFGFGLDLSGLNPGQVAILVALGLVKVR